MSGADTPYRAMRPGLSRLRAIIYARSCRLLSWRQATQRAAKVSDDAPNETRPHLWLMEILAMHQGAPVTAWGDLLGEAQERISMDGKGFFRDNIIIVRLGAARTTNASLVAPLEPATGLRGLADLERRLQPPAAPSRPRRTTARHGLPCGHDQHAPRPGDPESSLEIASSCPGIGDYVRRQPPKLPVYSPGDRAP